MKIVLGPPGTGKTTYLLDLVDQYLQNGTPPDRIGYVAFTRRAANEALTRACERFGLSKKDLPYFKTLHALAYHMLLVGEGSMMAQLDYDVIADWASLPKGFNVKQQTRIDGYVVGYGDPLLDIINFSRVTCQPLDKVYAFSPIRSTYDLDYVKYIHDCVDAWKRENEKYDHTDLLEQFIDQDRVPRLDVLFVDEAQDLSPIQWRMVDALVSRSRDSYIAGDDDQAIYRWAGADVAHFINLEGEVTVLTQSHRIPQLHHRGANKILKLIRNRRAKEFNPRDEEGAVVRHRHSDEVDLSEGTWLLMARTAKEVIQLEKEVKQRGLLYSVSGGSSPVDLDEIRAARTWEALREGRSMPVRDLRHVYEFLPKNAVMYGHKSDFRRGREDLRGVRSMQELRDFHGLVMEDVPWDQALLNMEAETRNYLRAAMRKGEDLTGDPRIRISTIHGAKGAEADNVLLMTDNPTPREARYKYSQATEEDEHRVWYVAATRAKYGLHLINPQRTQGYYVPA